MGGITLTQADEAEPAATPPWTTPPPEIPSGQLAPRRVRLVFFGLVLALLLAALEQMTVATALPEIAAELHGLDRTSWVITAYLLTATVALPVYGKCGDLYGRKGAFQFAVVVFVVGSALTGRSRTMDQLIAFRALQGIGAGGLLIGVQAIMADIVPARARGRFVGLAGAAFGLASVAGPLLGGYVTDHLSWRWCFYGNVPFGLVALTVVTLALKLPKSRAKARFDVLGALLLAVASACLVLLAAWGGTEYPWGSDTVRGLGAAAVGAAVLFLVVERHAPEPLVPLRLFKDSAFNVTGIVGLFIGAALFAAGSWLPTFLQLVDGASATESGLLMLPMTAGIVGASVVVGQLVSHTGHYRAYPVLGTALAAVGMWLLSRLDADTPRLHYGIWTAVLGAGIGMVMPVLVHALQNSVRPTDVQSATSANNYLRHLGGGVGVAVCGALLTTGAADLPHDHGGAYADTLPRMFLYLVPVLVLGMLLAFFLKGRPRVRHDAPADPAHPDPAHPHTTPPVPAPPTPLQPLSLPHARSPHPTGVPVRGIVRDHEGTVVPRAALTLIDVLGQQIGRGASGEDGRYALATPGAGSYMLIASAGGHQPLAVTVTLGERPVELDVVLGGAGRLAGRVITADGRPLRDATVTLTDVHGQVVATTRSGSEGGYLITEVAAGAYTLAAGAHTFRPAALPVTVQAAHETRQDIELAGGAVLCGTVRAAGGRPVEDARVTLLDATGTVVGTLTTGTDGAFRFDGLAAGEYTVIASGYPPAATALEIAGDGRTERDLQLRHED
ncbi:MFS transporter [Streptomyces bluensis]|uniref:MFS transporter n=1 Tax=Streptomyces bluensis TaxID=33897 RepID=UPI00167B9930|nr:MFS transporter [Streptomyces bluensis]GGZ69505.1 MFS transporter [Streptomyces bluensis]